MKKTDRKKASTFVGGMCLILLSLSTISCLSWILEKPTFVVREVTLSPLNLLDMNLMIGLDVANPNRFDLILKSFEYTVYLNGEAVGNGHLDRALLIPAAATTRVQAPLAATFKNLGRSLKAVIGGKDVSYKIEGKAEIKAFLISQTFPFSKEGILNPKP